jgi:hypothetical protein
MFEKEIVLVFRDLFSHYNIELSQSAIVAIDKCILSFCSQINTQLLSACGDVTSANDVAPVSLLKQMQQAVINIFADNPLLPNVLFAGEEVIHGEFQFCCNQTDDFRALASCIPAAATAVHNENDVHLYLMAIMEYVMGEIIDAVCTNAMNRDIGTITAEIVDQTVLTDDAFKQFV